MRLKGGHILLAGLFLLLSAAGCSRHGRVIPADTFAKIYADMFIADQWLGDHGKFRRTADTTLFYEPIFRSYGYSFKDYDRSVGYYLDNPEKYSHLIEKTGKIIDARLKTLKAEEARIKEIEALEKYLKDNALPPVDFALDTLLWKPDSLSARADSLKAGADSLLAVSDSLRVGADSLLAAADSLVAQADTLAAPADSSAVPADSPAAPVLVKELTDSILKIKQEPLNVKRRHGFRSDSLPAARKFAGHKPLAVQR